MGGKLPTQTYHDILDKKIDVEYLRNKLKLRHLEVKKDFSKKYPHVEKYLAKKGVDIGKIRQHSAKALATGTLAGTLLLAPAVAAQAPILPVRVVEALADSGFSLFEDPQKFLATQLKEILPKKIGPLTSGQEKIIGKLIENVAGIKARANLEGEHLNTTYGYIGAEQHLPRFSGDTVLQHDEFREAGITPGRGAWGYFAPSKSALTESDITREKYYVAVQTLYLPDWEKRLKYLRDWYKYRKVIVLNPENGKAVVAVVADSGPAAWTGKHFGGSPEVMHYLGGPRYKKGNVILFFVDDPENEVSLGPVNYNILGAPKLQ